MSYIFSINSSENNTTYVSSINNHRSILLLQNTSTVDVILQNININLNFKNNNKEHLVVTWKLILNPITDITPTWVSTHANSIVEYSDEEITITTDANTEVLLTGYISETLTLNVDTILNNKIIGENDIVALTLEYVGTTVSTQNPTVGGLGSITWSEGPLATPAVDTAMAASLASIETSIANLETIQAAIQTLLVSIDTSNAQIVTNTTP